MQISVKSTKSLTDRRISTQKVNGKCCCLFRCQYPPNISRSMEQTDNHLKNLPIFAILLQLSLFLNIAKALYQTVFAASLVKNLHGSYIKSRQISNHPFNLSSGGMHK